MKSRLDLNTVRVFVAVVDKGSFAGAARMLSLPTSNVSRYVAQLEAKLGLRLLERSSRHLNLTEAGKLLHQRAKPMLDALEQTESELTQRQVALRGILKVTMPTELGPYLFGPVLAEFVSLHPGVELHCETELAGTQTLQDDIDVSIVVSRGPLQDSTLVSRPIVSLPSVVLAAPTLIERTGLPQRTAELKKLPCITTFSALKGRPWQFVDGQGEIRHVPVASRYRVNSGTMAYIGAVQGLGFAILAEMSCRTELQEGQLQRVPLEWEPAPLTLWAVHRSRHYVSAKIKVLLELIHQRIPSVVTTSAQRSKHFLS